MQHYKMYLVLQPKERPEDTTSITSATDSEFKLQLKRYMCSSPSQSGTEDAPNCKICPNDWELHRNTCYWISQGQKTWTESQDDCKGKNSTLIVIRDQQEMLQGSGKNLAHNFPLLPSCAVLSCEALPNSQPQREREAVARKVKPRLLLYARRGNSVATPLSPPPPHSLSDNFSELPQPQLRFSPHARQGVPPLCFLCALQTPRRRPSR
uniref:uncharacterized protein LOC114590944 n=1 Tax=Podarcis muralis TaxID=64176 RepID=UPI0010A06FD2|nr:uncharacterized protein LOC114590944 [Podarcis muralis]